MKRLKKDKVKRGRIILSAILTFAIALLCLGFGAYMGYITLDINYLTIGTMTYAVGGLLVIAGFFIFFGCIGGVISLKELFISSRNEEKFSAYKGSLISAIVFYCVIALISIIGIIVSISSYIPSNHTWIVVALAILTLVLCASAFYCVLRELKDHKKKIKNKNMQNTIANMDLSAQEIRKFSDTQVVKGTLSPELINESSNNLNNTNQNVPHSINSNKIVENCQNDCIGGNKNAEKGREDIRSILGSNQKIELDLYSIAEKLMQLDELRKAGLITEEEHQELKKKCMQ